ncbi:T9SS type A sorting domain-containing protein, partial [bacterium]|nr:T9SS type A sorting domain-containing protein [bacterium]
QSGHITSFTLPTDIQLERGKTYWWRAYSITGEIWSTVSETRTLSLADSLEFQNVRIVPNPAVSTSLVRIYVQLSLDTKITIRFYNKLGRELDKLQAQALGGAQGNIFNYDISKYACGIYFYVIEAESEFGTSKITKQFAVVD